MGIEGEFMVRGEKPREAAASDLDAFFFFFKQKTAYELTEGDWSSDVCSSDLVAGLGDGFEVIVGADDVTHPKPHPEPVLKALERLGAPAADTVFIGDSRHDIECGRAAGVKTAAVLWGPFDRTYLADLVPDYWLERPEDLATLP